MEYLPKMDEADMTDFPARVPGMFEQILLSSDAAYVIFWVYDEPAGVIKCLNYHSIDGVVMQKSTVFTTTPGVDILGKVWEEKRGQFVKRVRKLDKSQFLRLEVAAYYRIASIAFIPYKNGILEFGSKQQWKEVPRFELAAAEGWEEATLPEFLADQAHIMARVIKSTRDCHYAVFWKHFKAVNELKVHAYSSADAEMMELSRTFTFSPGVDAVGRAWKAKSDDFLPSAQEEDIRDFMRKELAVVDGAVSIAFAVFQNGVLEYGSRTRWDKAPALPTGIARQHATKV